MNHNTLNLEVGEIVWLEEIKVHKSKCKIISFMDKDLHAEVQILGEPYTFKTLTSKLTRIKEEVKTNKTLKK